MSIRARQRSAASRRRPGTITPQTRAERSARAERPRRSRVAIACQGGGSHTAFTAGVLEGLLANLPEEVDIVALSGTSGGALCASLAWDGLLRGESQRAIAEARSILGSRSRRAQTVGSGRQSVR